MSSNTMLEINDLVVSVEDNKILNGLNLKINKGEIHAIMGPNGSGKSTLSNVIAGKPGYVVESGEISRRVGSYVDNCTNVHSEQDLIDAEANIEVKQRVYELGNQGE